MSSFKAGLTSVCIMSMALLSCRTNIYTVSSPNVPQSNNQFVYENDTLRVSYNFWSRKGYMNFTVYNKLSTPIFIDWKLSGFIDSGIKYNYYDDISNTVSNQVLYKNTGLGSSSTIKAERIAVITPHSAITRTGYPMIKDMYHYNLHKFKKTKVEDGNKKITAFVSPEIKHEQSDWSYRNFLVYSSNENISSPNQVDNEFFISQITVIRTHDNTPKNTHLISPLKFYVK